jgi:aminopeptidase YwaD
MEVLRHLVQGIGPRWAGRPGAARAADYLAEVFADLGLEVTRQDFPFVGWEVDELPTLEIRSPEPGRAAVALMEYSGATPPDGVVGAVRPAGSATIVPGFLEWPRYAIVGDDGTVAARLIAHIGLAGWTGPAIPLVSPEPFFPFPAAILSEEDHHRFQRWLGEGKRITAHFRSRGHFDPGLTGHNVIAVLPGDSADTVVVCAHLDTAFGTPGAHNNASGVQAMVDVARRLQAEPRRRLTTLFAAFDASEWLYLGSRYFVAERRAYGNLSPIVAAINLDTVAMGDQLYFLAWPETMRRRAEQVVADLRLADRLRQIEYLGPLAGSDHYSFIQAGIPAAEILFWPCTVYKTPADDLSQVDAGLIELSAEIALALIRTFEEEIQ